MLSSNEAEPAVEWAEAGAPFLSAPVLGLFCHCVWQRNGPKCFGELNIGELVEECRAWLAVVEMVDSVES